MKIRNDQGQMVDLDLTKLNFTGGEERPLSKEQQAAVERLLQTGRVDALDKATQDQLRTIKARIGAGSVPEIAAAILVRFDLKWVSIS